MTLRLATIVTSTLCILSCTSIASSGANPGTPRMPFVFAENRGQADPGIRFIGTGPEFKVWVEDRGVILQQGRTTEKVSFENSAKPLVTPEKPLGATVNYLHGSDPHHWQTGIALFGVVRYTGLWQGVDLTYSAEEGRLKAE
jgi:hypothetical protein